MLRLFLGIAFLTGFGFGAKAVVLWLGICLVALARRSVTISAVLAVCVLASIGALFGAQQHSGGPAIASPGEFEGTIRIADGPYLTQSGQRFLVHTDELPNLLICAFADSTPQ